MGHSCGPIVAHKEELMAWCGVRKLLCHEGCEKRWLLQRADPQPVPRSPFLPRQGLAGLSLGFMANEALLMTPL